MVRRERDQLGRRVQMKSTLSYLLASAALASVAMVQPAQAAVQRFHDDHVLGASMDMTVVGADAATAARALAAAHHEIQRLDKVLSGWRADSELARLNVSTGPVAVSRDLFAVIEQCESWRQTCQGAFSARLGAVEALWRQAEQTGVQPNPAALSQAAAHADSAQVRLDPARRTIDRAGVTFAVDALAKGYIVDAALNAAARAAPTAQGLMLDIGGDLRCRGVAPGGSGWRIGLARGADADNVPPAQLIRISNQAVATSGPGARDRTVGDCAVSHTLSPAGGQAAAARTVTVVADHAAGADALATALGVMPVAQGLALAECKGAQARIVDAEGTVHASSDWDGLIAPASLNQAHARASLSALIHVASSANTTPWPAGFQVDIDYEIPSLAVGRYRPPFVVIWITDEQGKLVRTLFQVGGRPPRYQDSNYVWWTVFNADSTGRQKVDSVTRPTRQPGKYSAQWDGKDDMGNLVGQGRYTINIETSREHGGHTLQTIALNLGQAPLSGSAAAGDEAGPAAARYGKPAT
jgi:thiamine biosynthesis lipoprotein